MIASGRLSLNFHEDGVANDPDDFKSPARAEAQLTSDQVTAALPRLGRELVAVVGFEAAMKLIEERGGQRITAPSCWPPMRHSPRFEALLVEVVGETAAQQFCDRWGGIEFQVPMATRVQHLRRVRSATLDYEQGTQVPELARRYGTTESNVWKWLKKPV